VTTGRLAKGLGSPESAATPENRRERAMAEVPEWRKALQERNAIGWIGFMLLVLAIGFGSLFFGGSSPGDKVATHSAQPAK
jgi:hypothetical protein